jgi:hypothetical protein
LPGIAGATVGQATKRNSMTFSRKLAAILGGVALGAFVVAPASADKYKRPIAVFAGLDKITGRIISFEVAINETVQFGSLQITPRVCYNRPLTEAPRTDAFAEVDEVEADKTLKRIFTGWMFADSPGLHGIEHPVYDIWLTECKGDGPLIKEAPDVAEAPPDDSDAADNPAQANAPAAAATPAPKPTKTRRPRPRPTSAGLEPPADIGRTPSRQFYPDSAAPGAPMHIGR